MSRSGMFDAFIGLERLSEYTAEQNAKRRLPSRVINPGRRARKTLHRKQSKPKTGMDWINWANKR